ncbi:MAG: hypothetical protein Q9217_000411 [Psora testacea]
MSDSIDRVFVHALNTVKRIPRTGSARPPESDRLKLYGLYKQSMEGDVEGVVRRPEGGGRDEISEREKWYAQVAKADGHALKAKRQYISTLIETMHHYATNTPEARELVAELEFLWDQIKSNPASSSASSREQVVRSQSMQHDSTSGYAGQGARGDGSSGLRMLRPLSDGDKEDDDILNEMEAGQPNAFEEDEGINAALARPSLSNMDVRNHKWRKRVEQALVKMTIDISALREQMEAMRLGDSRGRNGLWTWVRWLVWALIRHLLVDAALLSALILWARRKRNARLEQGLRLLLYWVKEPLLINRPAIAAFYFFEWKDTLRNSVIPNLGYIQGVSTTVIHIAGMAEFDTSSATPAVDAAATQSSSESSTSIAFSHHGVTHTFPFPPYATLTDLSSRIETDLYIPASHQKFMITPKLGILKPPFSNPSLSLGTLQSKKIVLLAPTASELSSVSRPTPLPQSTSTIKTATPARHRDWRKVRDEATYTFHTVIPLPYLPNPSRSQKFLERLRDDPGIKAAMTKHKFSVGVLTEMDPAEHTTHESKTLGLNRNRGEVIELRLRTDAYDGYRDYKVIRDTLCHELAHNVWGDHDRNFWNLTKSIEKEVRQNDWKSGGQALSNEVFYDPEDREGSGGHVDGGGWSGGEFVLGGSGGKKAEGRGFGRREVMARAAEERMRRQKEVGKGDGGGSSSR